MRCLLFRRGEPLGESITLANRVALIFSCVILSGCSSLSPSGTSPIALDYNYRSVRPLIPDITHQVDTIEEGRVYDVSSQFSPYRVRVKSNGPQSTAVELFMPVTMYNEPLRDALAKCP